MLKITYTENGSSIIDQYYDIETEIKIDEEATLNDLYKAMCKMANIATYHGTLASLKRFIQYLEAEGFTDDDRIM